MDHLRHYFAARATRFCVAQWRDARCFEIMAEDLRILLREFVGRKGQL